jgi:hypothetical protein
MAVLASGKESGEIDWTDVRTLAGDTGEVS